MILEVHFRVYIYIPGHSVLQLQLVVRQLTNEESGEKLHILALQLTGLDPLSLSANPTYSMIIISKRKKRRFNFKLSENHRHSFKKRFWEKRTSQYGPSSDTPVEVIDWTPLVGLISGALVLQAT